MSKFILYQEGEIRWDDRNSADLMKSFAIFIFLFNYY